MSKKLEASRRAVEREALAIARANAQLTLREKRKNERAIRIDAQFEIERAKKQARLDRRVKNGRYTWGLAIEIAHVSGHWPVELIRRLLTKVSPSEHLLRRAMDGLNDSRASEDRSWRERDQLRFLLGEILENFLGMPNGPATLEQLAARFLVGRDLQQALIGIASWCELQDLPKPERSREAAMPKPRRPRAATIKQPATKARGPA